MPSKYEYKYDLNPLTAVIPVGVRDIDELVSGTSLSADRVRVFLHQLYVSWIFDELNDRKRTDVFHKDGWVLLSSKRLTALLTNKYKKYEVFLESEGIIQIKRNSLGFKSYVTGERSTSFRLTPGVIKPINGKRFRQEKINEYKVLKAIHLDQIKFEVALNEGNGSSILPYCSAHEQMNNMLSQFYFDVDGVSQFVDQVSKGNILLTRESNRGIIDCEAIVQLINEGTASKPIVCSFGERFHSSFTRIPREYRHYLRIKRIEEELTSVDISNCQVYIVAIIINFPEQVKKVLPEFEYVLDKIKEIPKTKSRLFLEHCIQGTIYEYWQQVRGLDSRDDSKNELIKRVLFDKTSYRQQKYQIARDTFRSQFSDVWDTINTMKTISNDEFQLVEDICLDRKGHFSNKHLHKIISSMCQRFESRVMTGMVVPCLIKQDLGPFLTIHDSVVVPYSKAGLVSVTIQNCFLKLGITPPKVKIERYGKSYPGIDG